MDSQVSQPGRIAPHSKGIDIIGTTHNPKDPNDFSIYIVRSDLGYYLTPDNKILPLHPALKDGDHYFAKSDNSFFVIKGDTFLHTTSLGEDMKIKQDGTLHPDCLGGDHYMATRSGMLTIKKGKVLYRTNLATGDDRGITNFSRNPGIKGYLGMYYWCTDDGRSRVDSGKYYVALQSENFGFLIRRNCVSGSSLVEDKSDTNPLLSFPFKKLNFVPGGLYHTMGQTTGRWTLVKSRDNRSNAVVHWSEEITYIVGQSKSVTKTVEKHWNVSSTAGADISGGFAGALLSSHLSVTGSYGKKHVDTSKEDWSDERQATEAISIDIPPGEAVYIWQFKFVVGEEDVLFSKHLQFTSDGKPPTEIPIHLLSH